MTFDSNTINVVLQAETNECGLACLGMILASHKHHISLGELRHRYPGDKPLTLEQLIDMIQAFKLQARALRCEPIDLVEIQLPAIVHVDFEHYVVLEKIGRNHFTIIDPARGRVRMDRQAFSRRFTGIVLEVQETANFEQKGIQKRFSPLQMIRQLPVTSIAKPLFLLLLLSLGVQGFALISPFFLQVMVDEVLMADNLDLALIVVGGFALVNVVSALTQWFRGLLVIHIGNQLSFLLAAGLFNKLLQLHSAYFSRRSVGDIVSRFGSMQPLQTFVSHSAVTIMLDVLMVATTLIMLACYSMSIALYIAITVILYTLTQYLLMLPYRGHTHEQIIVEASAQSQFIETVQNIETVKRFEAEQRRATAWLNQLMLAINAQIRAGRYRLFMDVSRYLLSSFVLLGVVYISLDDITSAALTIGMLYAMVSYSNHLTLAVLSLISEWQQFMMLSLHVQRLSDITEADSEEKHRLTTSVKPKLLTFRNVSFRFSESERLLINGLDLSIAAGETVAITGPSGCGKSTLLKLMLGDETPTAGQIALDGRPLQEGVCAYSAFSTLFQSDQLLNGSVGENISFMDPEPDQTRIMRCAEQACIHEDILALPLAYQQKISESGHSFSAGQRQRLLIARLLYRRAAILIVDEGTCHLDEEAEQRVMNNLVNDPRTCIFVTHQEALTRFADKTVNLAYTQQRKQSCAI